MEKKQQLGCVLIVDDEKALARSVAKILEKQGFECVTAENARDAWTILESQKVDLCITDVAMPGESGVALLQRIRSSGKFEKLPVIIHSAFADRLENDVVKLHPFRFIKKPSSAAELIDAAREAIKSTSSR